ncbi:MAG: glycine cleavage system protein H [Elusimicrobia bacterium CG08_land_8_20_14_0_20_51_18]|nr:MAG: glycine cleavage system protein H [Elusimicrobia bacterium CG08_land_8_20_14_0_20_51_18]
MKPEELKYTKTHEWLHISGDAAVVGISDHAQHEMGDIVFVDLPKVGSKVQKEKQACVVESVKSAFDIYAPVSGEITEANTKLSDEPALVNQSPLENGWLFKMKISAPAEASDLMDWNAYQEFVKTAAH